MQSIYNKYGATIVLLVAVLGLGSCSRSFVNKAPQASILSAEALTSPAILQSALNGLYAELRNVGQYGRDFPVLGDLQADNTFVEARNSGRYISQYNYSVTAVDGVPNEMWAGSYTGILRANEIIDAAVTGAEADQIKAQAYALRALLYFKLVNVFATPYTADSSKWGVPLVLHYNPTATPGRASIAQVYNQIVSDLKTAMLHVPAYVSSILLSKYAVEGLLARTYLYEGDYPHALTAAADVIAHGPFTLVTPSNFFAYWSDPTARTDMVETMFEIDADAVNNNGFDDLGAIYVNGYQDIYCSKQLYALYSSTDVRQGLLYPGMTKGGANAYLVLKFSNAQNTDRDNLKVIRLAEVYLIAAEASYRSNPGLSKAYLNALIAQRDPAFPGYSDTGGKLLADIVQERRKELAFEGDRLYDLNRLGLPIHRVANDGAIPAGTGNVNLNISYPDNRRVAPIPQQELVANPTLAKQQNPGY